MSSYEDVDKQNNDNEHALKPSTLENIDTAMLQWLKEDMAVHAKTNEGWRPVPVIWAGEERVYQVKEDRDIRDQNGSLIFPLITLRRTSKSKSMSSKGSFWADVPEVDGVHGGVVAMTETINQDKSSNFKVADAIKESEGTRINFQTKKKENNTVYKTKYIPLPVYIDINYQIILRADFQQQINDMVTPFINYTGAVNHFLIENNGWSYECFFEEEFSEDNNTGGFHEEERVFKTAIDIRTLGYLIGDDANEKGSEVTVKENAVKVSIEEKIVTGSIPR